VPLTLIVTLSNLSWGMQRLKRNDYGYDLWKGCRIIWRNCTLGFCMEHIEYTGLYARRVDRETCQHTKPVIRVLFYRKVRQYVVNREWGNIPAGQRRNHFPFHVWLLAQNWMGQRNYLAADVCKKLLSAHKNCSQNLLTMSKFIVSKNLLTENQICSRRINFAHGESWIALHSTCNLSMDAWHDFYLHPNCSKRRKFAHSKEKLLTKIKFAQSKNLLKKIAHGRNLLTEFARSIEKLLTIKNLAGSGGSTRWLNVSHQANRSTADAHHSTVSVVTAGTCWAGPSRYCKTPVEGSRGCWNRLSTETVPLYLPATSTMKYRVLEYHVKHYHKISFGVAVNDWNRFAGVIRCQMESSTKQSLPRRYQKTSLLTWNRIDYP
jgi:hypothetical protein